MVYYLFLTPVYSFFEQTDLPFYCLPLLSVDLNILSNLFGFKTLKNKSYDTYVEQSTIIQQLS